MGGSLRLAFCITLGIFAVELTGGFLAHSLALPSDAGHVLTDLFALGLSWFAVERARKPPTGARTFGYSRTGVLAAQANSVTLLLIVGVIGWEAISRLTHPPVVTPGIMFVSAGVGLVANLLIGIGLRHDGAHNLNVRSALLHVMGDAAASAAVILGGLVILITGQNVVDPILSLLIALLIAWGAWRILGETTNILMEGTPQGLNTADLIRSVSAVPGVRELHDLHVWSIDGQRRALSAHVRVDNQPLAEIEGVRRQVLQILREDFLVDHATLQFECDACGHDGVFCQPSSSS